MENELRRVQLEKEELIEFIQRDHPGVWDDYIQKEDNGTLPQTTLSVLYGDKCRLRAPRRKTNYTGESVPYTSATHKHTPTAVPTATLTTSSVITTCTNTTESRPYIAPAPFLTNAASQQMSQYRANKLSSASYPASLALAYLTMEAASLSLIAQISITPRLRQTPSSLSGKALT
jgi:hypothetical protein